MARNGGNAQDRRRARRAADRRTERSAALATTVVSKRDLASALGFDELVAAATDDSLTAAASGSTSLPLSDQDKPWDASAADKRVRDWAGADDAPNAKYARAFFVKQGDGSNFGDYKLGYADVVDGKLVAVWRGVTAVAGVLQGARGGVQGLSDAETSSVKTKVAAYYAKAADQYDDDTIKVPWEADESKSENALTLLALAELTPAQKADLDLDRTDGRVAMIGGSGEGMDAFLERRAYWDADAEAEVAPEAVAAPEVTALERLDASLVAAAGDVAWGPEDGFLDLLSDVNALLNSDPDYCSCRAIDAGVRLDKVLISDWDGDTYWSAPISIDAAGEPVLQGRDSWVPIEQGWVEVEAVEEDEGAEPVGGDRPRLIADSGPESGMIATGAHLRFALEEVVLADGALAPMLPDEHQPGERVPKRRAKITPPEATQSAAKDGAVAWQAKFVPEGTLTDDGRAFAPGSLDWRELPLSLMAMIETSAQGGHDGAMLSGRIDRIWREGNDIMAEGVFDDGEFGMDIARMVGDGTLRGLSVDIAIHDYEVGPKSDYFDEDGVWRMDAAAGADVEVQERIFGEESDQQIFVVTKGVIGMATVCPFPAFAEASISLIASGAGLRYTHQAGFVAVRKALTAAAEPATVTMTLVPKEVVVEVAETGARMTLSLEDTSEMDEATRQAAYEALLEQGLSEAEARGTIWPEVDALTASAAGHAPLHPPAEWFEDPGLTELTPLTITDDGRIYGHAWSWETCHISFPDACVLAPHSRAENAYFHLGEIECEDGKRLSVGKVTIDAPHAGQRLGRADATAHYDHTGTVAAHVRCGEDEFGGWVAGAIHPDLPDETLRLLRGSALSGDWRSVNGNLELVALLAVNVPGFPVPRPRVLVASGDEGQEVLSLTAAGVVLERTDEEEIADIEALALEARG